MQRYKLLCLSALLAFVLPFAATAQIEPDSEGHYADPKQGAEANPTGNVDWSLERDNAPLKAKPGLRGTPIAPASSYGLPSAVHNGTSKYYRRPVINQKGNSCGITSRVTNMMAYELNAYRDKDGSLEENMLPPHFAFVPAYNGGVAKETYAKLVGIPDAVTYGGSITSSIYGGPYSETSNNYGRMQGYDKWYKAMFNRISNNPGFPNSCMTAAGALAWKRWLYNHNGDTDFHSGGVIGIGIGSDGMELADIPSTTANDAAGVSGLKYISHFGTSVDHAVLIVGYDDRIEFDLDGDGVYGESSNALGQNETGAWIVGNSWGSWGNDGFAYIPYALADATSQSTTSSGVTCYKAKGSGWTGEVYKIRKDYRPLRTLKASVAYSKRSEISIALGVAQDISATAPEKTLTLVNHNYHGDCDGDGVDAEVPMLGQWADGKLHGEAMEFGYDITDFTSQFDTHRPLKYFLIIKSKSGASGTGQVEAASILNYELGSAIESPFTITTPVSINNNGGTTTITTIVYGEDFPAPAGLALSTRTLSWTAPAASGYTLTGYKIYQDDAEVGTTTSTSYTLSATPSAGDQFTVCAVYSLNGSEVLSSASNSVSVRTDYDTKGITLSGGSITIPGVTESDYANYTIEYLYKPNTSWKSGGYYNYFNTPGTCILQYSSTWYKQVGTSFTNLNSTTTPTNGSWNRMALVFSGGTAKLYINGTQRASTSTTVGSGGNISLSSLYGTVDEIRVWSTARSTTQMNNYQNTPIGSPETAQDLLAYFKGDTFTDEQGVTYLRDYSGHGNHAVLSAYTSATGQTLSNTNCPTSVTATISAPTVINAGTPVTVQASHTGNVAQWAWTCSGATISASAVNPTVMTFPSAGSYTISLKVTDVTGNYTSTITKNVTVSAAATPTADFDLSKETAKGGESVSLLAKNQAPGCTYSWSMPGADVTTANTRNVAATYSTTGEKTVTLTVTAANGTTYTRTRTLTIVPSAPAAFYSLSPAIIVKGENVTLTDQSLFEPTQFNWRFESNNNRITYSGATGTIAPSVAGVYDLTYTARNDVGSGYTEGLRALIVCNSNSYNGLTFGGSNQNVTATLPSALTTAWTIDYWLNPAQLSSTSAGITGSNSSSFTMTSDENGSLTLTAGSQSVTANSFYVPNQWHHYAITFSNGALTFYRDGVAVKTASISTTNFSTYFKSLQIGGTSAPLTGSIDEFRVWNTALTQEKLRTYCVAPIANVATAQSTDGLQLYWQMNQTSGNVTDATSNGITGTRNNFRNDGDAWGDSKGVFALSFSTPSVPSATAGGTKLSHDGDFIYGLSDEQWSTNRNVQMLGAAFDGNTSTYYSSRILGVSSAGYDLKDYPHSFVLDRVVPNVVNSIALTSNGFYSYLNNYHSGNYGTNATVDYARAATVSIEQSDDNENWEMLESNMHLFNLATNSIFLTRPLTKRFARFSFNKPLMQDGKFAALTINELDFYGSAGLPSLTPVALSYVSCSDEETTKESRLGSYALDGDESTFWHTVWSTSTAYPHNIVVQNASLSDIDVFRIVGGHPSQTDQKYWPAKMNVETSSNGTTWTTVQSDVYINFSSQPYVRLDEPINARYIRLTFTTNRTQRQEQANVMAIREIYAYASDASSEQVNVTWNVKDAAGNTVFTITTPYAKGATVSEYPEDLTAYEARYVSYPTLAPFTATGTMTKNVTYTWTGPFNVSDNNTANYYYLRFFRADARGTSNCMIEYLSGSDLSDGAMQMLQYSSVPATSSSTRKLQWAFYGNPFQGFTIKNREAAGSLYANNAYSNGGIPVMSESNATTWKVLSGTFPAAGFTDTYLDNVVAALSGGAICIMDNDYYLANQAYTDLLKFLGNARSDWRAQIIPTLAESVESSSTVTWNVVDNASNVLYTVTKQYDAGTTVSSYPAELTAFEERFVSYPTLTPFTATGTQTKNVSYTWTGPFQISDESNVYEYNLKIRGEQYITSETNTDGSFKTVNTASEAKPQRWSFYGNPFNGFTIRNATDPSKSVYAMATPTTDGNTWPELSSTNATQWVITSVTPSLGSYNHPFSICAPSGNFYWNRYKKVVSDAYVYSLKYWKDSGTSDVGAIIEAIYVEPSTIELTWNITDGANNTFYSVTKEVEKGTSITAYPDEFNAFADRFVTYPALTSFTASTNQTINVPYVWNGPFELTTDMAHPTYYYFKSARYGYYAYTPLTCTEGSVPIQNSRTYSAISSRYAWFFTGNPFDGIELHPYNAPSLGTAPKNLSATPTTFIPRIGDTSKTANYYSVAYPCTPFGLVIPGADETTRNSCISEQFNLWSANSITSDWGCNFVVEEVDESQLITTGYYRIHSAAAGKDYSGTIDYNDMYLTVDKTNSKMINNRNTTFADRSELSETALLLTEQDDFTYTISKDGYYMGTQATKGSQVPATTTVADAYKTTITPNVTYSSTTGFTITVSGSYMANISTWNNPLSAWTLDSDRSLWKIEPVELPQFTSNADQHDAEGTYWCTAYLPFDYTLPADVTPIIVRIEGNTAVPYELTGRRIPAGTGIIWSSEDNTPVRISYDANAELADVSNNDLIGTYVDLTLNSVTSGGKTYGQLNGKNVYVLNAPDGTPGFYRYHGTKLSAYKAFLNPDKTQYIRGYIGLGVPGGDDDTTGIDALDSTTDDNAEWYDLQGRRIAKPEKGGVYIRGGQKVYVK